MFAPYSVDFNGVWLYVFVHRIVTNIADSLDWATNPLPVAFTGVHYVIQLLFKLE